ncbi:hypothetical protein MBLNU459_g8297t2 [Dothideomycetes sp. NU459]
MAEVLTDDGTAYDRSVDLILNEALRSETRMLCGDVADGYAELSGPRASASVAAWDPSAKVTLRREGDEGSENDDDVRQHGSTTVRGRATLATRPRILREAEWR